MAVLGIQIVITMIFASFLSKITPIFSLGRFLLLKTGLVRFMHPSDEELRQFAPAPLRPANKNKRGRGANSNGVANSETFNLPRSSDIQLQTTPVTMIDVVQLRYYSEYEWLIDFSLCSALVYVVTEIYVFYFPAKAATELNLSMLWCILAAGFAYKILGSLCSLFFQVDDSGERSLVIVMGFAYLFIAMLVLIVPEETLETGLDVAYSSFNKSAALFLADNSGLDSSGPASKLVLKVTFYFNFLFVP